MGLISKEAALAAIDHEREMLIEQRLLGAEHVVVHHARRLIEDMQTVPAVPLDKLCEWLGKVAIFRCCECTSNCCDGEECSSSNHFDKEIKKWMENECGDE